MAVRRSRKLLILPRLEAAWLYFKAVAVFGGASFGKD